MSDFGCRLTRIRRHFRPISCPSGGKRLKRRTARIVPNHSAFRKRNPSKESARYGSLKSPACSCVSITLLLYHHKREPRHHGSGCEISRSRLRCSLPSTTGDRMGAHRRLDRRRAYHGGAGLRKRAWNAPMFYVLALSFDEQRALIP